MVFDNFGRHFGAPRVTFRDSVLKWGSQGSAEQDIQKKETLYPWGRTPRRGTFGFMLAFNMFFFVWLFGDSKKAVQMELPKGSGYAIRQCLRMFRKGRSLSLWLHFGLHFGVIWGTKFATILLFGRPGGHNRLTKERLKKVFKKIRNKLTGAATNRSGRLYNTTMRQSNCQTIRLSKCHYSTLH